MRIGFVWTGFTSYMADCWRELASRPGVALKIWIEEQRKSDTAFDVKNVMRGLDFGWDYSDQITDIELRIAESEIKALAPTFYLYAGGLGNCRRSQRKARPCAMSLRYCVVICRGNGSLGSLRHGLSCGVICDDSRRSWCPA